MGWNHISKLWWFTRFEIAVRMDESNSERILQGHWSARRRLKLRTWIIGKSEVQISKERPLRNDKSCCNVHHRRDNSFHSREKTYLADGQDYHSLRAELNGEYFVVNPTKDLSLPLC